jgi:hypothetical protein
MALAVLCILGFIAYWVLNESYVLDNPYCFLHSTLGSEFNKAEGLIKDVKDGRRAYGHVTREI